MNEMLLIISSWIYIYIKYTYNKYIKYNIYTLNIYLIHIYELNESPHILYNLWIFLCVIMLQQHVDITP